jgi:hypothetical protein
MTGRPPILEQLRVQYEQNGLRPAVDPVMEMIVMDCPRCKAQDVDPTGLYRPLRVVPRGKTRVILCTACGARDEQRLR